MQLQEIIVKVHCKKKRSVVVERLLKSVLLQNNTKKNAIVNYYYLQKHTHYFCQVAYELLYIQGESKYIIRKVITIVKCNSYYLFNIFVMDFILISSLYFQPSALYRTSPRGSSGVVAARANNLATPPLGPWTLASSLVMVKEG